MINQASISLLRLCGQHTEVLQNMIDSVSFSFQ